MPATIKIKNSSTASAVPTSSDLVQGELAVNVTDRRLFTENASGTVVELGTNPTILTMGAAGSASAPVITRTGDTNTGIFFPAADTIAFAEGGTEAMRLDSAGNMGLGVTPNTWAGTGVKAFQFQNGSLAASSSFGTMLSWNAYYDGSYKYTASTTAGMYQVGGAHSWYVAGSGTAGNTISFTQAMTLDASGYLGVGATSMPAKLTVQTGGRYNLEIQPDASLPYIQAYDRTGSAFTDFAILANNIRLYTGGSERARIDSSGNLLVGVTSGGNTLTSKSRSGNRAFSFINSSDQNIFYTSSNTTMSGGENGANAAGYFGKDSGTNRSINAAGTINASGADYAEYMTKTGNFIVAKGDIVGINAEGKLTNVFADAVSFAVKSTDPSYVGGDIWGNEEAIGLKNPDTPHSDATDEEKAQYETDKAAFETALELARQSVDRIAFAGQVPVNVTGATAGQYIIPVNDNGSIKGQAVSNPTFEQYQIAVGKVIAIEQDGRARIIVKVA